MIDRPDSIDSCCVSVLIIIMSGFCGYRPCFRCCFLLMSSISWIWRDGLTVYRTSKVATCPPWPPSYVSSCSSWCVEQPGSLPIHTNIEHVVSVCCPIRRSYLRHFFHAAIRHFFLAAIRHFFHAAIRHFFLAAIRAQVGSEDVSI